MEVEIAVFNVCW